MIRLVAITILWLALLLPLTTAQATSRGLSVSTTSHGIKLTLAVPRRVYPRNALVQVTVTLRNVSGRTVALGPPCAGPSPGAAVFTRSSQQVYPPAVPGPVHPTPGCFPRFPHAVLPPGAVRVRYPSVILGGANVAGTTVIGPSMTQVRTPSALLVLTHEEGPRITYSISPHVVVTVHPVGGEQVPLHYAYGIACDFPSGGGAVRDSGDQWHSIAGTQIPVPLLSGCTRITNLYLAAGWMGHPVARLNYAVK